MPFLVKLKKIFLVIFSRFSFLHFNTYTLKRMQDTRKTLNIRLVKVEGLVKLRQQIGLQKVKKFLVCHLLCVEKHMM